MVYKRRIRGSRNKTEKAQSAIEYLVTHAWALLVLVLVLGVLFRLGVFSGGGLGPKQFPTQCQDVRPLGPGTGTEATLVGACNSQVPEFVAQLNGVYSSANIPDSTTLQISGPLTIVSWVYTTTLAGQVQIVSKKSAYELLLVTGSPRFGDGSNDGATATSSLTSNTWTEVAAVWSGTTGTTPSSSNMQIYINGNLQSENFAGSTWAGTGGSGNPVYIGTTGTAKYFPGSLADVQIYNETLTQAQILQLYAEGIGGPPIDPVNIAGWWPLNGDIRDYSGNVNSGTNNGISFSNSWTTGYSPPA